MRPGTSDHPTYVLVGGMNPDEIYQHRAEEVQRWKDTLPAHSSDEIRSGACRINEFPDEFCIKGVQFGGNTFGVSLPKCLIQKGAQTGQRFFVYDVKAHFEGRGMSHPYYIATAPFYIHLFSTLRHLLDADDPGQKAIAGKAQQTLKWLIDGIPIHTLTEIQYGEFGDIISHRQCLSTQQQAVFPLKGIDQDIAHLDLSRSGPVCQMLFQADLETITSAAALFNPANHGMCAIRSLKKLESSTKEVSIPLTLTYTAAGLHVNIENSYLGAGLGIQVYDANDKEVLP